MFTSSWRKTLSPRSKQLLAVCFCVLLTLPTVADGRKVALSRVTKPTSHRGYANADIAKLSYSPSHSAAAAKPAAPVYSSAARPQSAPAAPHSNPGQPPSYGWAPQTHGATGGNYGGGAAVAGAAGTGIVAGNVYRSHGHNSTAGGGFGGGLAHPPSAAYPSYPVQPAQGFPGAPVQHPGGGFPAPGYQPQPVGGYVPQQYQPQSQPGFPHQPSYVPQGGGHYQGQPGHTVVHHYEQQPSSGGSGIGTVLGAGAAGLAAGIGGAALYDALKPKDSKEEPAVTPATTTTTVTAAPVPIDPNGGAPLAPLPVATNPNGDTPLAPIPSETPAASTTVSETPLAPMSSTDGTSTVPPTTDAASVGTSSSENPLGMAPLAPMPDASAASSSIAPPSDSSDIEVPHSALNVQPNLSATMGNAAVEPASGKATESVQLSSAITLAALVPIVVRYLRF